MIIHITRLCIPTTIAHYCQNSHYHDIQTPAPDVIKSHTQLPPPASDSSSELRFHYFVALSNVLIRSKCRHLLRIHKGLLYFFEIAISALDYQAVFISTYYYGSTFYKNHFASSKCQRKRKKSSSGIWH